MLAIFLNLWYVEYFVHVRLRLLAKYKHYESEKDGEKRSEKWTQHTHVVEERHLEISTADDTWCRIQLTATMCGI